jgi:hypothetical protein
VCITKQSQAAHDLFDHCLSSGSVSGSGEDVLT